MAKVDALLSQHGGGLAFAGMPDLLPRGDVRPPSPGEISYNLGFSPQDGEKDSHPHVERNGEVTPTNSETPPPGVVLLPPGADTSPAGAVSKDRDEDVRLRSFLAQRGFTKFQIDDALSAHRSRMRKCKQADTRQGRRCSQPILSRSEQKANKQPGSQVAARPSKRIKILSVLVPSKLHVGERLIKRLLISEKEYCAVLECLRDDYYTSLAVKVSQGKLQLSQIELDDIFHPIVELLMMHRSFYSELSRSRLKRKSFFRVYTNYISSCMNTVGTMRNYSTDEKLHQCLTQIKGRSKYQEEDMVDLLLKPFDRIIEYKEFFFNLCKMVDESQLVQSEILFLTYKSICTAATYIKNYRQIIFNRNEMNKIQKFLGDQCNIFGADRRIMRQGMLSRRTKGWTARKKQCFFFLFTDILLWTTKKGELLNAVYLQICKILPSTSKSNPSKKFKIGFRNDMHKPLFLECTSRQQRDEWYQALQVAVWSTRDAIANSLMKSGGRECDERKRDEDIIYSSAHKVFGVKDNDKKRNEGVIPGKCVDEPININSHDANSSPVNDIDDDWWYSDRSKVFDELDALSYYSSGSDMYRSTRADSQLSKHISASDNSKNIKQRVPFQRAVIMSPKLKRPMSERENGEYRSIINPRLTKYVSEGGSLGSKRNSFNESPVLSLKLLRNFDSMKNVDEKIRKMKEHDKRWSLSDSVQQIDRHNLSCKSRHLFFHKDELMSHPGSKTNSAHRRNSFHSQTGLQHCANSSRSKPSGVQSGLGGSSFLKLSLNGVKESHAT